MTSCWIAVSDLIRDGLLSNSPDLRGWERVSLLGNLELLRRPGLGLFCSIRCPGKVILELYDLARALRDAGVPVISGFHTPMEKECLKLLLRGTQPVLVCPARGIPTRRIPAAVKAGLADSRVLYLSPFDETLRRPTADLAGERNRFVAALAPQLVVAYASPGGKTEQLCRWAVGAGKSVLTLADPENAGLLALGARECSPAEIVRLCSKVHSSSK